jgi:hypothetical protein
MSEGRDRWLARAIAVGLLYLAAGIVFGSAAGAAGSIPMRTAWRAAAFLFSGVVYVIHLGVEWKRRRPLVSSLHAATAVAIGAFALALSANVHSLSVASANRTLLRSSLLVWPLMTGLPAFLVAVAATTLGSHLMRRADVGKAPTKSLTS